MADAVADLVVPQSTQVALFLAAGSPFKSLSVASAVVEGMSPVFRADPTVISLPPEAPPEIPRVIVQENGVGQLLVGQSRANLVLEWKMNPDWAGTVASLGERLVESLARAGLSAHRLGLVFAFGFGDRVTIEEVRRRYVCAGKMADAEELQVAWLRQWRYDGIPVNRWVRLSYAVHPGGNRGGIIDMNTSAEVALDVTPALVGRGVRDWLGVIRGDMSAILEW